MGFRGLMRTLIYTHNTITMNAFTELLMDSLVNIFYVRKYFLFLVQTVLIFPCSKMIIKK